MLAKYRRVAVITRTKDRKILLRRALESVCGQTFQDFMWVVVNDGGNREEVDRIVEEARKEIVRQLSYIMKKASVWKLHLTPELRPEIPNIS